MKLQLKLITPTLMMILGILCATGEIDSDWALLYRTVALLIAIAGGYWATCLLHKYLPRRG